MALLQQNQNITLGKSKRSLSLPVTRCIPREHNPGLASACLLLLVGTNLRMVLGGFIVPGQSDPTAITLLRQELRALSFAWL